MHDVIVEKKLMANSDRLLSFVGDMLAVRWTLVTTMRSK